MDSMADGERRLRFEFRNAGRRDSERRLDNRRVQQIPYTVNRRWASRRGPDRRVGGRRVVDRRLGE